MLYSDLDIKYIYIVSAHHSNVCQGQHDRQGQLEHSVSIALTEAGQREQRDGRHKVDLGDNKGVYL